MNELKNRLNKNRIIAEEMMKDKEFCFSIVNCKDRKDVKDFLASKGIDADDKDIDELAKNISEVADICEKIDEEDLDKIIGGDGSDNGQPDSSKTDNPRTTAQNAGEYGIGLGLGISGIVVGGLLVLSVVASGIKTLGDNKGWWNRGKK